MARRRPSLFEDLFQLPWWVGVVLAAIGYSTLKWALPWYSAGQETDSLLSGFVASLAAMTPEFAPFALLFLVPAAFSAFQQWKSQRLLNSRATGGLGAIHLLDWQRFEALMGEYYRRKGYRVRTNPAGGPDGGVDLWVRSDQGLYLVQCKHWRRDVGVKVVRELYGVMAAEGAYGGAVVTSGSFSAAANAFASGKAIDLIDGDGLRTMVAEVQRPAKGDARRATTKRSRAIDGDDAVDAIRGLAREHPHLAHHIERLGFEFLRHAKYLRDGRAGRTYDLGFVDDRRQFADLTATPGKHNRATDGRLQVQLRYRGDRDIRPFKLKEGLRSEADAGWHATQIAEDGDVTPLLNAIKSGLG